MTTSERFETLTADQQNIVTMLTDRMDKMEANLIRTIESNKRDTDDDVTRVEGRLDNHIAENKQEHEAIHTRISKVSDDSRRVGMSVWERVAWVSLTLAAGAIMYMVRG